VSGGGGSGSTIQDLERAVIDLGRRPTAAVTFAPQTTVMADPLQTKEGLRQLQDAAIEKVYEELDKQSPAFIARLERAGFRRTSS